MPQYNDARPVTFFRITAEDYENLDATVEWIMRAIEEMRPQDIPLQTGETEEAKKLDD